MVKNLIPIMIAIVATIMVIISKPLFAKIIGIVVAVIAIAFIVLLTIGFVKERKEEKRKKQ